MTSFTKSSLVVFVVAIISLLSNPCSAEVVNLNEDNFNKTLATYPIVLVTFYTDWCPHSQRLLKSYEEGADEITAKFPKNGNATMVKVNCNEYDSICSRYGIMSYPSIEIIKNGNHIFKFSGPRSLDNIFRFVDEHSGYFDDGDDFNGSGSGDSVEDDKLVITNDHTEMILVESSTDYGIEYVSNFDGLFFEDGVTNTTTDFNATSTITDDYQDYSSANTHRAACSAICLLVLHCLNL